MKVEFLYSNLLGSYLSISASEFVKAKNSSSEFDSLFTAVHGYASLWNLSINFSETSYDFICGRIDKGGSVIFKLDKDGYGITACVLNNNHIEKILIFGCDGHNYRLISRVHLTSKKIITKRGTHNE